MPGTAMTMAVPCWWVDEYVLSVLKPKQFNAVRLISRDDVVFSPPNQLLAVQIWCQSLDSSGTSAILSRDRGSRCLIWPDHGGHRSSRISCDRSRDSAGDQRTGSPVWNRRGMSFFAYKHLWSHFHSLPQLAKTPGSSWRSRGARQVGKAVWPIGSKSRRRKKVAGYRL